MLAIRILSSSLFNGKNVGLSVIQPASCGGNRFVQTLEAKLGLPERPKKPMTPFLKYSLQLKPTIKKENPNIKITEFSKKASLKWNEVDSEIKTQMQKDYIEQLAKYKEQQTAYLNSLTPEQKAKLQQVKNEMKEQQKERKLRKEKRLQGQPKRPATPFGLYLKEQIAAKNIKGSQETTKQIAEQWKKLTEEAKAVYTARYKEARKEYDSKLLRWEEDMVRQGKQTLVRQKSQFVEPPVPVLKEKPKLSGRHVNAKHN